MFSFNKTIIGHLHKKDNRKCEDYSISYDDPNKKYSIIVVSDGHGADDCFRSAIGSELACKITVDVLKQYADSLYSELNDSISDINMECFNRLTIKRLTDTILAKWYDLVLMDYNDNAPSNELVEKYDLNNKTDFQLTHIYGATLIAAMQIEDILLLFQQGDGRCDLFYEDGSIEQPIPWDSRCEYNVTTSLCDSDAADSIRVKIINTADNPVIACFLGSDGVEDAFRDTYFQDYTGMHQEMEGVHTFYKNILCKLFEKKYEEFIMYLDDMLPQFSENGLFDGIGSGDDVSVAGIINKTISESHYEILKKDVSDYGRIEELEIKASKIKSQLNSKKRKRDKLNKKLIEAEKEYELKDKEYKEQLNELINQRDEYSEFTDLSDDLIENEKDMNIRITEVKKQIEENNDLFNTIKEECDEYLNSYSSLLNELRDLEEAIGSIEQNRLIDLTSDFD